MQVYGSRKCVNCLQRYEWTGSVDDQINAEMQNQILSNRDLHFAKFSLIQKNTYKVKVRCPYCKEINEFEYRRISSEHKQKDAHMILSAVAICEMASFFFA